MVNQKGGVGKTTSTCQLAGTLTAMNRRVLVVDNDPQGSLTQGFWGPEAFASLDPSETVSALYAGDEPTPSRVIRPVGLAGIDIVPGSSHATRYNVPMPWEAEQGVQDCLKGFLDEVSGDYDLVLIDCPPNLHLCTWAALVAAEFLVVPVQVEDYGVQGLASVNEWADLVRSGPNPGLTLLGYLITMFNGRLAIHNGYVGLLRNGHGEKVFTAMIPLAADIKEAVAARKTIVEHKPKGASAKAFRAVAEELLGRVASLRNQSPIILKEAV